MRRCEGARACRAEAATRRRRVRGCWCEGARVLVRTCEACRAEAATRRRRVQGCGCEGARACLAEARAGRHRAKAGAGCEGAKTRRQSPDRVRRRRSCSGPSARRGAPASPKPRLQRRRSLPRRSRDCGEGGGIESAGEVRRRRDWSRAQRPDRCRLPGSSGPQGSRARAQARRRRRGRHGGGVQGLPLFGLLLRGVAAATRDHP